MESAGSSAITVHREELGRSPRASWQHKTRGEEPKTGVHTLLLKSLALEDSNRRVARQEDNRSWE